MEPGAILSDKYRLVSLLGRGGMGEVWRAEHLALRAPIAVKLMNRDIVADPEALARFNREAQAAAALRSPHVVQVLDHGVDKGTGAPFIAMELMEGESLAQRLERVGRLSLEETSRIVTHVARALARAHEVGIVHRDLKPDNIFLVQNEDEEIAKVLDFGIAKANALALTQGSATRTGAVMGTPYYMSPEQITGAKNVDHRTDLWALGVIACECLTARAPFNADTIGALVMAICATEPPRPSSLGLVPPGFDQWFARATARVLEERFQTARELAESLRKLAGQRLSSAELADAMPTVPERMLFPQPSLTPGHAPGTGLAPVTTGTVGPLSRTQVDPPLASPKKPPLLPLFAALGATVLLFGGAGVWFFSSSSSERPKGAARPTAEAALVTPPSAHTAEVPAPATPKADTTPVVSPAASTGAAPSAAPQQLTPPPAPPRPTPARPTVTPRPPAPQRPPAPALPARPTPPPANDPNSVFDRRKG